MSSSNETSAQYRQFDIWHDPEGCWAEEAGKLLGPFEPESDAEAAVEAEPDRGSVR